MAQKKGLGRGLNDLLGTSDASRSPRSKKTDNDPSSSPEKEVKTVTKEVIKEVVKEVEQKININLIEPNKSQPRKQFDEEALQELSDSIKKYGVLEPLIVTKKSDYYEIIAGERRWRAARLAGLKEIPVVIREYTDKEIMEISLIENIQREDLNPIEEAQAYEALISQYNLKQEEVAERVSKSRSTITNSLRLLKLCEDVRQMVMYNMISTGHARALIPIEDPKLQYETAAIVYDQKLSVRETEAYVKSILQAKPEEEKVKKEPDKDLSVFYSDIENKLKSILGAKIARALHLSFSNMLMLIKFMNLIVYLVVMVIAIKMTKVCKYALVCIALMPTSILQASSITYDGFVLCFVSLGVVLLINEIISDEEKINTKLLVAGMVAITVGSLSKMVYAPLVMLALFIPNRKFSSKKSVIWFKLGILAVCGWMLTTFVLPTIASMISPDVTATVDIRGGDTNSGSQIGNIIGQPFNYAKELLSSIFSFENFGISAETRDPYTIGNLMLMNYGGTVVGPDKFAYVIMALIMILICKNKEEKPLNVKTKLGVWGLIFIIVVLIWTAMYLAFTPVGQKAIVGVQARYYLPLIYMLFALLPWNKKCFDFKREKLIRASLCIVQILGWVLMYQTMIQGRLV